MEKRTPYFSDDDYVSLTLHIQNLLDQLEELPHPRIKETVFELLGSIDMMHREALVRMLILTEEHSPELMARLEQDTVVRSVLELYELVEAEFVAEEDAGSPVKTASTGQVAFIPLDQVGVSPGIKEPIWIPGGYIDDLSPGVLYTEKFEDVEVLLCIVEGEIFAMRNTCLDSILPLASGRLEAYTLICPWHGCRYDLRTGELLNDSGLKLETFPVRVGEDGRFRVGFNIPDYAR